MDFFMDGGLSTGFPEVFPLFKNNKAFKNFTVVTRGWDIDSKCLDFIIKPILTLVQWPLYYNYIIKTKSNRYVHELLS